MTAPATTVAPAATRGTNDSESSGVRDDRRGATVLRAVSHLAAELPLVVLGVVELARGWRPLYDNADLALRSYQVFTSHPPLVGHQMAVSAGTHAVFGPGPVQNWVLAVPVRIDPAQGVLWGSLVAVVVAVALAVEASWSVAGWRGAAVASGSVLVLGLARTDVPLDVAWNVWFGLFFLITTVATGSAVATGRLRWWPVTVGAATVVVQCQAAFAPPAVAVCLLAPAVGIVVSRRTSERTGTGGLLVGAVVGAVVWVAPVVQQVTTSPGNLTLLARAARDSGPSIGVTASLRALGGATWLPPSWVHPLPSPGTALFFAIAGLFAGPAWWGITVLALLAGVAVVGWRGGRTALAATAAVVFALTAGTVVSIATVPGSQFLVVGYLGALWVPVGTAVWVAFVWAAWTVVSAAARLRGGTRDPQRTVDRWRRPALTATAIVLVVMSAGVVWRGLDRMDGTIPALADWSAVHATAAAADVVQEVAPTGPFRLQVAGPGSATHFAVVTGVAYLLVTRGYDPRPDSPVAYATFGRPPDHGPTVVLTLAEGGRVSARRVDG